MPYDPSNNPYIPGDPYSYDLKWVVEQLEYAISLYTPLSTDFQELHDYVMNYFDNLDLSQEVSDKIDEMVSDGTFADLLQIMFDAYEADIDRAIQLQNEAITILENRMDTFASLPPGSTAGNAELLDIRVEYNGQIATSAGDAVRGQINELHSLYNTLLNAVFITDQASGAIASFPDGADNIPPKRAVFNIDPVQDLHGYSAPWPAGGGKNKFDKDADDPANGFISGQYIISVGLTVTPADPTEWNVSEYIPVSPSTTYTLSGLTTFPIQPPAFCQYRANQSFITGDSYTGGTFTFTTEADAAFIRISIPTANESVLQLEAGSTVTAYEPYSNICPISGFTGAEITATGKNLLDPTWLGATDAGSGNWTIAPTTYVNVRQIPYKANTQYKLSYNVIASAANDNWRLRVNYTDGTYTEGPVSTITLQNVSLTTTAGKTILFISRARGNDSGIITLSDIMFTEDLSASYEPFGTAHDITWADHGTVYGGTLEYLGGDAWRLTASVKKDILDNTIPAGTAGIRNITVGDTYVIFEYYPYRADGKSGRQTILSDTLKSMSGATDDAWQIGTGSGDARLYITMPLAYSTEADIRAYFTNNPTTIIYPLATPTYYTITGGPNLITLLGANNIFSDTGDADITYRADPTLYLAGH